MFTRYLPAELLKEVNVVDTPGTNVILGRQQRLTEEYVPRADLVRDTRAAACFVAAMDERQLCRGSCVVHSARDWTGPGCKLHAGRPSKPTARQRLQRRFGQRPRPGTGSFACQESM